MNKFTITWLDSAASDKQNSFGSKLGDAQLFTNVDDCKDFILSRPNEPIYLIVSGSLAQAIVPEVYEASNLVQVFVYCGSVVTYAEWALDYCEKLLMFDHGDDLLERLWNEISSNLREQAALYTKHADECKRRALQYKQPSCG